jgi:hypothetical protein
MRICHQQTKDERYQPLSPQRSQKTILLFAAAKLGQISSMTKIYLKAEQQLTKTLILEVV